MNSLTDDKIEVSYRGSALLHLLSYMKPYVGWVCLALILVLCLTGFDLYRPLLIGDAIDLFEQQDNYSIIVNTAIRYAIVLALGFVFNITQNNGFYRKPVQKIILTIRKELYAHIQSLSSRYFDLTPVGKLVTRVTNDVEALNEMYSGILVNLFRNIIKIAALAGVMLLLDARLALFSFLLLPIVVVLTAVFRRVAGQPTGLPGQGLRILTLFFPKIFPGCGLSRFLAGKKENMKSLRIKATSFTGRFIGKCWFSPFSAL